MSYFDVGSREADGTPNAQNPLGAGFWTIEFTPQILTVSDPFEVYHIAVRGPVGSNFDVYRGIYFWDSVPNGFKNGWDPAQPMPVRPGESIYLHYNTATAPAPTATLWLRIPL